MKKLLFLAALIIAVGGTSYYICYHRAMARVVVQPNGTEAELAWVQHEFALTPDQYEKVQALHHAYAPVCAGHCERYQAAQERLGTLLKTQTSWSPALGTAVENLARIQSECRASMLKYAYSVAACMSPEQSRRYLDMIGMHLVDGSRDGMEMLPGVH